MKIGVPIEQLPGERRVALVPASIAALKKAGFEVMIERGAGERAGFPDSAYQEKGGQIAASRADVFAADVVLQVRASDFALMRPGQIVVAMADPLGTPETVREMASRGVTAFALELIPRITRAQSMDVLSSMATIAGYKAVLLAAGTLPRMFPLLDDRRRDDHSGSRLHRRRRRGRSAGHRHRPQARSGRRGVRRTSRGQGTGAERRREVRRAAARNRHRPKTKAATRKRRTSRFTSGSAR